MPFDDYDIELELQRQRRKRKQMQTQPAAPAPVMPFGMPDAEKPAADVTAAAVPVQSEQTMRTWGLQAEMARTRPSMSEGNMPSPAERAAQAGDQIGQQGAAYLRTPEREQQNLVSATRKQTQTMFNAPVDEALEQLSGGLVSPQGAEEKWLEEHKAVGKVAGIAGVAAMVVLPDPIMAAIGKVVKGAQKLSAGIDRQVAINIVNSMRKARSLEAGAARTREVRALAGYLDEAGVPAFKADAEAVMTEYKANPASPELPVATGTIKAAEPPIVTPKPEMPVEPPTKPVAESLPPDLQSTFDSQVAEIKKTHPVKKIREPQPTTESLSQPLAPKPAVEGKQAAIDAGKGGKITLGKVLPGETPPKSGGTTLSSAGGGLIGFHKDDEGNWEYDPVLGMVGLIGGLAVVKGVGKLADKVRKPDINFEHFNISAAERPAFEKAVNDAVEANVKEWKKIYGENFVLTNDRLKALADDAKALNHIIPIGQQEKFISSVVAAGQKTLALGKEIGMGEAGKVATLSKEFVESLTSYSSGYTFFARGLQSGKVLKDPILNLPQNKIIRRLIELGNDAEKITEAFKGVDLNNKRAVIKVWNQFVKPSLWNRIRDYRYFNMLSSPLTQMRNNFGNASQIALRAATKTLTFDHPITYIKTVTSKDVQMKAIKNFWNAGMGRSWGDIRPDFENLGGTFAFPFSPTNMLEASDQYFRTIAIEGEKAGLLRKGFTEAAAQSEAERRGAYAVFRSELDPQNVHGQGWLLSWLDKATGVVLKARELEPVAWYVPFVQTPMQIFKQGIEYSPLGFATIPKAAFKGEQAAKAAMGSMVFATAGALAMSDRLTWASPKSAEQRKKAQETGWQPYSVRLGEGTYVSYSGLGPVSYAIAMAAAAKYYYEDAPKAYTQDFWTNFGEAMRGTAQFLSDQSYMQGMGELVDAVSGDVDIKRALTNPARQLIPATALQSAVSKFFDPVIRKAEGGASAKSMGQTMIRDMIYFSKLVPAVKDEQGNPIERRNTGINTISPLRISTAKPEEISEYNQVGEKLQFNAVKTKAKDLFKDNPDSPEAKQLIAKWNQAQSTDRTKISIIETQNAVKTAARDKFIDEGVEAMKVKIDTGDSKAWDAFMIKKAEWNRTHPPSEDIKASGYFHTRVLQSKERENKKAKEHSKNLALAS